MPLQSPNLDDRDFKMLVDEAAQRVRQTCPTWTDLSPGDPGMVLLELFAHLTETMIYRLNRLPEKAYYEFLNLIGVKPYPPSAAVATLRFTRSAPADAGAGSPGPIDVEIAIPAGVRVTRMRSEAGSETPVFITGRPTAIAPGAQFMDVEAYHCEQVEGELIGVGIGLAGLSLQVRQPPIITETGDEQDLQVGVEVNPAEITERIPAREFNGKTYRIWRPVDNFTHIGADRFVYTVDRLAGAITFAPAARMAVGGNLADVPHALAEIPPAGREIRAWYRRGGGPAGNVAAGTLTVLKDVIPGVSVTNPGPATGGRAAETTENALVRGPQELHALERAVTARDFENRALAASGTVARARAITQAALWAHAVPGTVEVLLVPYLPEEQCGAGQVTVPALQAQQSEAVRDQIRHDLDERRPLGTACAVTWARYKPVAVQARVVVRRQENLAAVEGRVLQRLYSAINPLSTPFSASGWQFGQSLRASHIYDIALAEPGVLWVDRVKLRVAEVPDRGVTALAADPFQADTWYAASGATLFRSLDDGGGWEPVATFAGQGIDHVRSHAGRAGLLAVVTEAPGDAGTFIHISRDCGESWEPTPLRTAFQVNGIDWTLRGGLPVLLLATAAGLYEYTLSPGSSPVQVLVDPQNQGLGFYAVAAAHEVRGNISVIVTAQGSGGLFLSHEGGQRNTFRRVGLQGEDIRTLAVQYDGVRSFLWAGAFAAGPEDKGKGCFRRELLGAQDPPEGWKAFAAGWEGGSCRALGFLGTRAVAASHRMGVLLLDSADRDPKWAAPDVRCGLPLRDPGRFQPIAVVAARQPTGGGTDAGAGSPRPTAGNTPTIMAGTAEGVYRSQDNGLTYASASAREFSDKVTLPPTWLFCSADHQIEVVSEDEAGRD